MSLPTESPHEAGPAGTIPRMGWYAVAIVVACLIAVVALIFDAAADTPEIRPPSGVDVPASQLAAIAEGAGSCRDLTGPRLAGQLMEASGFSPAATTARGGRGVAGLTDAAWQAWAPWPGASRDDDGANILGLAHLMCDLMGQVRAGGAPGDPWRLGLAAYVLDLDTVRAAGGVPDAALGYVSSVTGYADWYATRPGFATEPSAAGAADPSASGTEAPPSASSTMAPPSPSGQPVSTPGPGQSPATTGPVPSTAGAPPKPSTKAPSPSPAVREWALVSKDSGKCLSSTAGKDGTQLKIWSCDGSAPQRWRFVSGGTIRSMGLCMDAAGAGTGNYTPVQVARCSGNPAQQFQLQSDGNIYSPYAGRCLDVADFLKANGSPVHLWDCTATANQIWSRR